MNRVSLVCTVHEEVGPANVSELHAILARIEPAVMFLEVPAAAFDDFYNSCIRRNLESIAVRKYRNDHRVELVPVDLPTPEREFFENYDQLRMRTNDESSEYRQLINLDCAYVRKYGFAYLNSEHCSKLRSEIDDEMLRTVGRIGDPTLVEFLDLWTETLDQRENEMLKNIERHCRENQFGKGVFLVGAAHRKNIITKCGEQSLIESTKAHWDFDASQISVAAPV